MIAEIKNLGELKDRIEKNLQKIEQEGRRCKTGRKEKKIIKSVLNVQHSNIRALQKREQENLGEILLKKEIIKIHFTELKGMSLQIEVTHIKAYYVNF